MSNSQTVYPFIGGVDSQRNGVLDVKSIDSSLMTTPTITKANVQTALAGAGYLKIKVGSTYYNILIATNNAS